MNKFITWVRGAFIAHWLPTLIGWAFAFGNLYIAASSVQGVTAKDALLSAGVAFLGTVSKQFNKSNAPNPLGDAETVTS